MNQANIRNIGIIAHIDAGKTTLTERILFYTNKIRRMGEVHDGTATMDYMPEEQERGITITSACSTCTWRDVSINIIDTPGHVDFIIEVERALRVLDGAIGVFCAVGGVEPQTEMVWRQSEKFGVPKLAFVNKMDRTGADFKAVLKSMRERLSANPIAVCIPIGEGSDFSGIIDLIQEKKIIYNKSDSGRTYNSVALNEEDSLLLAEWRLKMLESLAEADDDFMEKYLEDEYTQGDISASLRRVTLARKAVPVLCGSALNNIGVQPLIDAVCDFLPAPSDIELPVVRDISGNLICAADSTQHSLLALVFKVLLEHGQKISIMRVYSGTVNPGEYVFCVNSGQNERVEQIFQLHADRYTEISAASAGDIVAVCGLHSANTGSTYAKHAFRGLLEPIRKYQPVISLALEPINVDEGIKLDEALQQYIQEDPTLSLHLDEATGARVLSGMGELHLEVILERMKREYGVLPHTGQPQTVLRETIKYESDGEGLFDKELGNECHFGKIHLHIAPLPRGSKTEIDDSQILLLEPLLKERPDLLKAIREGVRDTLLCGPMTGYPIQDIRINLLSMDNIESSTEAGCRTAAGMALLDALSRSTELVLEPIMRVEINVSDEQLGNAINMFNARSGKIDNLMPHAGQTCIEGSAPMRKLFGFATDLRSATQGRAALSMNFDRFDLA